MSDWVEMVALFAVHFLHVGARGWQGILATHASHPVCVWRAVAQVVPVAIVSALAYLFIK